MPKILALAAIMALLGCAATRAEPGACSGTFQWYAGGYSLVDGSLENNDLRVCNVREADLPRVKSACHNGSKCEIVGSIKCLDCGGSHGIFVEVTDITAIKTQTTQCIDAAADDIRVTWRGKIVSGTFMNNAFDETGREISQKYMALVPDDPQCSTYKNGEQTPERLIVLIWPRNTFKGPTKWVGHHVEIQGMAGIPSTAHYPTEIALFVDHIKAVRNPD
jgi:hypothetical protein